MVIVVGNGLGKPSSNPGRGGLDFTLGKVCILIFTFQIWVISWVDWVLTLVCQLVFEKENSQFKSVKCHLKKLTLCHILIIVEGLGKYNTRRLWHLDKQLPTMYINFAYKFWEMYFVGKGRKVLDNIKYGNLLIFLLRSFLN